ncbi:MAG: toll/interleukin-1 receptor domain-containing protein [Leifsonia sp.]|nr:toll/interleukin-1 receptor domain-containing protein [Leifsonia sp.]
MSDPADFFISYTGADVAWAEWIAWQLEQAGYKVVIQAWDFRPGSNFVVEMDRAAASAGRILLVMSRSAVASDFVRSEWAAAFALDPTGTERRLVPVRVDNFDAAGLLGAVVYIDLVGKEGDAAARALLAGVQPGRSKPTSAPDFPGARTAPLPATTTQPRNLDWRRAEVSEEPLRLRDIDSGVLRSFHTLVELHLIPTVSALVQASVLSGLERSLAKVGRDGGLFPATAALDVQNGPNMVATRLTERRDNDTGLLVTRSGQRSGWLSLPRDGLGSVFDVSDATERIAALVRILMRLDLPDAERYVPTVSIGPLSMLTVGDAAIVGQRTSASMRAFGPSEIDTPIEDSVHAAAIMEGAEELATEMVARLTLRLH